MQPTRPAAPTACPGVVVTRYRTPESCATRERPTATTPMPPAVPTARPGGVVMASGTPGKHVTTGPTTVMKTLMRVAPTAAAPAAETAWWTRGRLVTVPRRRAPSALTAMFARLRAGTRVGPSVMGAEAPARGLTVVRRAIVAAGRARAFPPECSCACNGVAQHAGVPPAAVATGHGVTRSFKYVQAAAEPFRASKTCRLRSTCAWCFLAQRHTEHTASPSSRPMVVSRYSTRGGTCA